MSNLQNLVLTPNQALTANQSLTGCLYQVIQSPGQQGTNVLNLIPVLNSKDTSASVVTSPVILNTPTLNVQEPVRLSLPSAIPNIPLTTQVSTPVVQQLGTGSYVITTPKSPTEVSKTIRVDSTLSAPQGRAVLLDNSQLGLTSNSQTGTPAFIMVNTKPASTVKTVPLLPSGHGLQIPANAEVKSVPASSLPFSIQQRILPQVSCNDSTKIIYVSPVNTVKTLKATPSTTVSTPKLTPLLPYIASPKASTGTEPSKGPMKWVVHENTEASSCIVPVKSSSDTASKLLKIMAGTKTEDINLISSPSSSMMHLKENALVLCNNKIYLLTKPGSELRNSDGIKQEVSEKPLTSTNQSKDISNKVVEIVLSKSNASQNTSQAGTPSSTPSVQTIASSASLVGSFLGTAPLVYSVASGAYSAVSGVPIGHSVVSRPPPVYSVVSSVPSVASSAPPVYTVVSSAPSTNIVASSPSRVQSVVSSAPPPYAPPPYAPPPYAVTTSAQPVHSAASIAPPFHSIPSTARPLYSGAGYAPSARSASTSAPPVQTVAAKAPPVQTVAAKAPPVQTVAAKAPPVQTVAAKAPPVLTVAAKAPPIQTVAAKAPPVQTVAAKAPVQTVAAKAQPLQTVVIKAAPVQTFAAKAPPVLTVAAKAPPVHIVAAKAPLPVRTVAASAAKAVTSMTSKLIKKEPEIIYIDDDDDDDDDVNIIGVIQRPPDVLYIPPSKPSPAVASQNSTSIRKPDQLQDKVQTGQTMKVTNTPARIRKDDRTLRREFGLRKKEKIILKRLPLLQASTSRRSTPITEERNMVFGLGQDVQAEAALKRKASYPEMSEALKRRNVADGILNYSAPESFSGSSPTFAEMPGTNKNGSTSLLVQNSSAEAYTDPVESDSFYMGQDITGHFSEAVLPRSRFYMESSAFPDETTVDEKIQRLKEVLKEREQALEVLRRLKKPSSPSSETFLD
ncbi:ligand-dependent nuclear receptor-interacting factor 1 [Hyperolius riggenbachi]|uniref:ligand-dependent nuclear receptor-interacting factor 1 n=1 Tax=Hyperolius riggenbachi TaxID=752182 RepID=UPI0035A37C76